jgi:cytochrome o ubiquinol oxidase subunit IV
MSALDADPARAAGHHGDEDEFDHDTLHITVGGYVTGFVLSVILTAIPFWLVMGKVFANPTITTFVIFGFAIVQIYVHMVFFLHMTSKAEGGWTWMSLIFTLVLVVVALIGSMWVMYHLNTNMMSPTPEQMRDMSYRDEAKPIGSMTMNLQRLSGEQA